MANLKSLIEAQKFEALLKEKVDPMVCVVELACCKNSYGKPFYTYIRIKPSEYMDYKTKLYNGVAINPNEYEILEYGWGEYPPAHVREMMETKYGVDHQFENEANPQIHEKTHKIIG